MVSARCGARKGLDGLWERRTLSLIWSEYWAVISPAALPAAKHPTPAPNWTDPLA